MMANHSVLVRVPATVGNFGGALDCSALALDAPLNVKVTPREDGRIGIRYFGENGERVPRDRSNLVVGAMESAMRFGGLEFTGADFEIYSSVPVAVGLGSSTAAVLAGLIAADQLFGLNLGEKALFNLAEIYEDRHDNLRAAWLGGFVAGTEEGAGSIFQRIRVPEDFTLHVIVPEAPLVSDVVGGNPRERKARLRSCEHIARASAIRTFFAEPGDGRSGRLPESLPPTCAKDVPGLAEALRVRVPGILSVFTCGSGPAVGILAPGDASLAVSSVRECFARHGVASLVAEFRPTNAGACDWNAVEPDIILPPRRGLDASNRKQSSFPA
jgi:homoserine kinase